MNKKYVPYVLIAQNTPRVDLWYTNTQCTGMHVGASDYTDTHAHVRTQFIVSGIGLSSIPPSFD